MRLRVSLVPIISHSKNPDDLLNHQPVLSATSSTTQLGTRQMATLLKVELPLCRFLELEYKLPPRDFHPPNPSLITASSVFLLYAIRGFLCTAHQPYLFLTYSTSSTVLTGFIEWTSVHHHSVCPLARHFRKHHIEFSTVIP